jgi:hypothetical protein
MHIHKALLLSAAFLVTPAAPAQEAPFRVLGYGIHAQGNVVYHYRVINNTMGLSQPVSTRRIEIGRSGGPDHTIDYKPEFTVLPIYDGPKYGDRVPRITAPMGWTGYVGGTHGEPGNTVVWEVNRDVSPYPLLPPGQTLTGLSVMLPQADPMYLGGNFYAINYKSRDASGMYITGLIEREDTIPPTLTVTLTPIVLSSKKDKDEDEKKEKSKDKLVPIVATITVKDDYDPHPEIKLESITANEPLESEDIKDAQFGTDDRAFKLKAEREGKNKAGRIYTVTYSATDGTGNKATASATVVVPHDERRKDD